jgi:hypothetical protein
MVPEVTSEALDEQSQKSKPADVPDRQFRRFRLLTKQC